MVSSGLLKIGRKSDATALRNLRLHELANGRENGGDRFVMPLELALEFVQLAGKLGIGSQQLAKLDERAHDVEAHFDSTWAVEDSGGHNGAVLGEREGVVACAATPFLASVF